MQGIRSAGRCVAGERGLQAQRAHESRGGRATYFSSTRFSVCFGFFAAVAPPRPGLPLPMPSVCTCEQQP